MSKDSPEAARRHRGRDGLGFALLCDPELVVTALREHFEHARAHLAEGWQDDDEKPARAARSGARASR
jgi:hypothetical protein